MTHIENSTYGRRLIVDKVDYQAMKKSIKKRGFLIFDAHPINANEMEFIYISPKEFQELILKAFCGEER